MDEKVANEEQDFLDNITLQQYMSLTYKFCPSEKIAALVNAQISQCQKDPRGRRYSLELKNQCLEMFFTGPKLYRMLMGSLCLPSPTTLLKLIKNVSPVPGLDNPQLFEMLKMKVDNFPIEEKQCVLCMDEMSLKANLFYGDRKSVV